MSQDETDPTLAQSDDLYHHGVITKLFPSNNTGIVRTESGREVLFSYELVILCGELKSPHELKEGQVVGYRVELAAYSTVGFEEGIGHSWRIGATFRLHLDRSTVQGGRT